MAITQAMCTSFKRGLLEALFDFSSGTTQTYKMALYTSAATLGPTTTAYTTDNEVSDIGTNYTAGGTTLTISVVPTEDEETGHAYLSFDDPVWAAAYITARAALIYLADGVTNPAVAVIDFGADKTTVGTDFTVNIPTADATNAILRIE